MMDSNPIPPAGSPPPPPAYPPPLARPARKSRGWMILAIILFVFLGFSLLINFSQMLGSVVGASQLQTRAAAGPRLEEVTLEDGPGNAKIAVIPVRGIITGSPMDRSGFSLVEVVRAQLERAAADKSVKAVVLKVDSPGGEVLASDEIARMVAEFQADETHGKPVVAAMGSLAASGGYYVSAPARWIVAHELTITGSIGVIMSTWNYRGMMTKVGIRPLTYKSGRFKDMLSGSREPEDIPAEERAMVQSLIDETYERFKRVVSEGRTAAQRANASGDQPGRALADDWREYADGRILSGKEAHRHGFVDELGDHDTALARAAQLGGVGHHYKVVEYRMRYDISDFFRLLGETEARAVKVDLGVEMPKLDAGRMYFLSPTYLH